MNQNLNSNGTQASDFYFNKNQLFVGKESTSHGVNDFYMKEYTITGRIYLDYNVISFWYIEKLSESQLYQLINGLKNHTFDFDENWN